MQMNDMILVSVDDHVCEPPDMWERHAPREVEGSRAAARHEGGRHQPLGVRGPADPQRRAERRGGPPPRGVRRWSRRRSRSCGPAATTSTRASSDMNANGVLGSLCFPTVPGFVGELFGRQAAAGDSELAIAMLRAYNDWHIDDWCGKHPGRFIPLAIPPIWDPEEMAREVRRVAKKGCHAITFADNPGALGYPSLHDAHWDPFWKACADEGTIVCIHIGSGTRLNMQDLERAGRDHDRRHADHALQLRHRAGLLGDLHEVPGPQDRALRGRDRLDPVLPRAHRLRPRAPPPLDAARLSRTARSRATSSASTSSPASSTTRRACATAT